VAKDGVAATPLYWIGEGFVNTGLERGIAESLAPAGAGGDEGRGLHRDRPLDGGFRESKVRRNRRRPLIRQLHLEQQPFEARLVRHPHEERIVVDQVSSGS